MFLFQIDFDRCKTPQQLQDELRTISEERKRRATIGADRMGGQGVIKIPGLTIHDDPFPPWAKKCFAGGVVKRAISRLPLFVLRIIGVPPAPARPLELDDINWAYAVKCESRRDAESFMAWFTRLRSWGGEKVKMLRPTIWEDFSDVVSLERVTGRDRTSP